MTTLKEVECVQCGGVFFATRKHARTCSGRCRTALHRAGLSGLKGESRRKRYDGAFYADDGYVEIYVAAQGRCIPEHRIVMARELGRELLPGENVHHINGFRDDNHPDNLELWSTSQPPGQRVIDKTAWAVHWLRQYAPDVLAEGFK